jgi:hypothetical protein
MAMILALSGCTQEPEQQVAQSQETPQDEPQSQSDVTQDSFTIGAVSPISVDDIGIGIGSMQIGADTVLTFWYTNNTEYTLDRLTIELVDETTSDRMQMISPSDVLPGEQSRPATVIRTPYGSASGEQMAVDELSVLENATRISLTIRYEHNGERTFVTYDYELDAYTIS